MSRLNGLPYCWIPCLACALATLSLASSPARGEKLERLASRTLRLAEPDGLKAVISAIQLQPGGPLVAAAGDTHLIHVWNRETGEIRFRLAGHEDWIRTLSISPNGQKLASGGNDGQVLIWDLASGERLSELRRRDAAIRAVKFSASGSMLAVSAFGERLVVYAAESREELFNFDCGCNDVGAVAFSPDDSTLAAGGRNGRIRVWNLRDPKSPPIEIQAHRRRIRDLAFSNSGDSIASCGDDGRVVLWDRTKQATRLVAGADTKHFCLAFVGESKLAVGGCDNRVAIWSIQTGQLVGRIVGHGGTIATMVTDKDKIATGSFDTTVRIWRMDDAERLRLNVRSPEERQTVKPGYRATR
jgi:WD40 repeat protein